MAGAMVGHTELGFWVETPNVTDVANTDSKGPMYDHHCKARGGDSDVASEITERVAKELLARAESMIPAALGYNDLDEESLWTVVRAAEYAGIDALTYPSVPYLDRKTIDAVLILLVMSC